MLSIEEYDAYNDPEIEDYWWLRSPCIDSYRAVAVRDGDLVCRDGLNVTYEDYAVRPVLVIRNLESSGLRLLDKFNLAGYTWTVISNRIALCDSFVGYTCFRDDWTAEDANVYEASDIKKWLDGWVKEKGIELVK